MTSTTLTRPGHRTPVHRRHLTRAAAWAVPVIAVAAAAPAYAASPCDTTYSYRLDWGTTPFTKIDEDGSATIAAPSPGASSINVGFKSEVSSAAVARPAANLSVPATLNIGGLGANERGLRIEHAQPITAGRTNRQTITITFGRAVTGLSFTITDVDSSNSAAANQTRNGWWDQVELSGTRDVVQPATITGLGTLAAPWKHTSANTNEATTGTGGNVKVTYPGAVSSITLVYWSDSAGGNQAIALSDFTFTAKGC